MGKYDVLIDSLKEQKPANLDSDEYLFSLYIPFNYPDIEKVRLQLKSDTLNALRNHPQLKKQTRFHNVLLDTLTEYLDLVPIQDSGIAIFFRVKISEVMQGKHWEIPVENISVIPMYVKPKNLVYIGKVFYLDQIVWANDIDRETLVVNLNETEASIYLFGEGQLEEIEAVEKKVWVLEKPEHFEQARFTGRDHTSYGSSHDKYERFEESMLNLFVEKAAEQLRKISKSKEYDIKRALIFHSNAFVPFLDILESSIGEYFNVDIKSDLKNITKREDLVSEVNTIIKSLRKKEVKNLFNQAKSNQELFVTGWKDVVDASRMKKIDTLFIHPHLQKRGYIFKRDMIYTYPYKGTRLVRNIYPWLIWDVITAGSKVVLLRKQESSDLPRISASLRF